MTVLPDCPVATPKHVLSRWRERSLELLGFATIGAGQQWVLMGLSNRA